MKRRLSAGSSALGERETVTVFVYDDVEQLRADAQAFSGVGHDESGTLGVTQCWSDEQERAVAVIVRLARGHLGTRVVSHELHHAATALYGAHVGDRVSRRAHLNHFNEPFAHLFSDLMHGLVTKLRRHGYYSEDQ